MQHSHAFIHIQIKRPFSFTCTHTHRKKLFHVVAFFFQKLNNVIMIHEKNTDKHKFFAIYLLH